MQLCTVTKGSQLSLSVADKVATELGEEANCSSAPEVRGRVPTRALNPIISKDSSNAKHFSCVLLLRFYKRENLCVRFDLRADNTILFWEEKLRPHTEGVCQQAHPLRIKYVSNRLIAYLQLCDDKINVGL